MRRHSILQRVAIALIAAQVVLAGAIVWGSRRDVADALVIEPTSISLPDGKVRPLLPGARVRVRMPRLFWQSRQVLPLEQAGTVPARALVSLSPPTEQVFVRHPDTELRVLPNRGSKAVGSRRTGDAVTVLGAGVRRLSGELAMVSGWRVVVLEEDRLAFVPEEAISRAAPSATEWLETARGALESGALQEAIATTHAASGRGDAFAGRLEAALNRASRHTGSAVLHDTEQVSLPVSAEVIPYDPALVLERVSHLHSGALTTRTVQRARAPGEPAAGGYAARRELELRTAPLESSAVVAVVRANTPLAVRELPGEWVEVTANVAPPALVEIDLREALTRGAAPVVTPAALHPVLEVRGYVPRDTLSMLPLGPRVASVGLDELPDAAMLAERSAASELLGAPSQDALRKRLDAAWTLRVPEEVAEAAFALHGERRAGGLLEAAEVLTGCSAGPRGWRCRTGCGEPLRPVPATVRTAPAGEPVESDRYLYLRLRGERAGEGAVQELPLSFVVTPKVGDQPCAADDAPRVASVLFAPADGREHDLWVRLPAIPLSRVSVVFARASEALAALDARPVLPPGKFARPEQDAASRTLTLAPPVCPPPTATATPP